MSGKRALMMWSTKNGHGGSGRCRRGDKAGPNIVTAEPNSKPAAMSLCSARCWRQRNEFAIANTFQKALQKLEGKDSAAAKLAKQAAFDFQMNPAQPGFSFERLNKSKIRTSGPCGLTTNSMIAHRASDMVTMCYVDRHEEAYSGLSADASKSILRPARRRSSKFEKRSGRSRR